MKKTYVKPVFGKRAIISAVTAGNDSIFLKPTPSDIRLKTDIEKVGVAANGLPLYTFRYIGSEAVYRGLMAQDVLNVLPEAVSVMPNGYLAVDYGMLGMEMTRLH